jgi:hypothetical protein
MDRRVATLLIRPELGTGTSVCVQFYTLCAQVYNVYNFSTLILDLVRVMYLMRGEVNEWDFVYYYGSYHRTISGIPLQ